MPFRLVTFLRKGKRKKGGRTQERDREWVKEIACRRKRGRGGGRKGGRRVLSAWVSLKAEHAPVFIPALKYGSTSHFRKGDAGNMCSGTMYLVNTICFMWAYIGFFLTCPMWSSMLRSPLPRKFQGEILMIILSWRWGHPAFSGARLKVLSGLNYYKVVTI